jgi:hypothetical protein
LYSATPLRGKVVVFPDNNRDLIPFSHCRQDGPSLSWVLPALKSERVPDSNERFGGTLIATW